MARAKKKLIKRLQTKQGRNKTRAANQQKIIRAYDSSKRSGISDK